MMRISVLLGERVKIFGPFRENINQFDQIPFQGQHCCRCSWCYINLHGNIRRPSHDVSIYNGNLRRLLGATKMRRVIYAGRRQSVTRSWYQFQSGCSTLLMCHTFPPRQQIFYSSNISTTRENLLESITWTQPKGIYLTRERERLNLMLVCSLDWINRRRRKWATILIVRVLPLRRLECAPQLFSVLFVNFLAAGSWATMSIVCGHSIFFPFQCDAIPF